MRAGPSWWKGSRSTAPKASDVGQISRLHLGEGCSHPGRCARVETVETTTERTAASVVDVFSDLDRASMGNAPVTYDTRVRVSS